MKKLIVLFGIFILAIPHSFAADSLTVIKDSLNIVSTNVREIKDSVKSISASLNKCTCQQTNTDIGYGWWLVFAPVLLFLVLFFVFLFVLKKFNFNDALTENEMPKYTVVNPQYANIATLISSITNPANNANNATTNNNISSLSDIVPPTLEVTTDPNAGSAAGADNYRPSISRYIAFFSGMLTVIIAVCMTSFFIYHYMSTGCPPDLSALSTVLIALGIGITPYAVNKVSTAIASKKTDD